MNTALEVAKSHVQHGDHPPRKVQIIEVTVFLFLIVPSMAASFLITNQTQLGFTVVAISSMLSDMALVSLVLYFIWRNGEQVRQIGLTLQGWRREMAWGLILFLPLAYSASLLERIAQAAGFSAPTKLPSFLVAKGVGKVLLALMLVTVVAMVEETIFRGYLIRRFKAATQRSGAAVLLSSAVFSLGHGYEGGAGMISVFFLGLMFAVLYQWRKTLVAPIVIHFLIDLTSIVLATLFEAGT